jgi:hypothetical protein
MQNLIFIIGIIALMLIFWAIYRNVKYANFQKNMSIGSPCYFYVGELKYYGWIKEIQQDAVVCVNAYNSFSVLRCNVHPL